ncbi:DUF3105 domain-containing protein [Nocardioides aquiterrae]|uniref:DUF3105 domain-containing protein n=1 Tax=Nocardioides aquiterrae TaxID=203799 RepID=A0ABP4F4R1_9ACTN
MSDLPTHPRPAYPPPPPPPAPRRRALPLVLALVAAVLLVGAAVAVPLALRSAGEPAAGPVNLDDVRVYDDLEVTHTPGDVDYPQSPPVGGPHAPVWLDCGVYDEPVRDENAVHDLEHGSVWITYDPDAGVDVAALEEALPQNGLLSPYDGLDAPVVVTVWGRQLELDGADDPRLELFIDTLGGGETAPEPFASCAGGIQDPDGEPGANV